HSSPSSLLLPDGGPATSREVAGPPSGSNKGCRWVGGARVLRWERRTPLGCPRGVRLERRELRRRCLSGPNRSASGSVARVTAFVCRRRGGSGGLAARSILGER